MAENKITVGIPYTVPDPYERRIGYTKGSGDWLETLADGLYRRDDTDVYTLGPAYERWPVIESPHPWHDLPIIYRPPKDFPDAEYRSKNRWEPVSKENIDVKLPIHGFTRGQAGYDVWADAGPREFRAIVETTRWYLDLIPVLHGFDRFDVCFPMHLSANVIASAHYFVSGKALAISHETCVRMDVEKLEGGWAAKNLRAHIVEALDLRRQKDAPRIIAISDMVKDMMINIAAIPKHRVAVVRNPYDVRKYFPIENYDRINFLDAMQQEGVSFPNPPQDGRWVVFVGSPREFKGVEQLIYSWAIYQDRYGDDTANDFLFIIGPELTEGSRFASLAAELNVDKSVAFMGSRQPEFINKLLNVSDLAVMTSLSEGDGVVVKQPGGVGIRVVAPNSGGPSEYFHHEMGTLVESRDPNKPHSSKRGYEILSGDREIKWGSMVLSGAEIIHDYIQWTEFYAGDKISSRTVIKLQVLKSMTDSWNNEEIETLKKYAAEVLRHEAEKKQPPFIPPPLRGRVDLLADVYRVYGGRDVENNAFADGYREELHQDSEIVVARRRDAYAYVTRNFSSTTHSGTIFRMLQEANSREYSVYTEPADGWENTVLYGFAENCGNHPFSANIADRDRVAIRDAFERLYQTTERHWDTGEYSEDLVGSVHSFNRAMVNVLGDPKSYPEKWPTSNQLGMSYDRRTDSLVAMITGYPYDKVVQTRLRLTQAVFKAPKLIDLFRL